MFPERLRNLCLLILDEARERRVKIAAAESCTGGLLSALFTEFAGSSDVFERGYVTYSNRAKEQMLGVRADTLDVAGAVSEAVAEQMATGALARSDATLSVSVTGIAGPGGSEHKPEGRVCCGIAGPDGVRTETVDFGAIGRQAVREASVEHALALLLRALT